MKELCKMNYLITKRQINGEDVVRWHSLEGDGRKIEEIMKK